MDINEIYEIALHLYMVKNNMNVNIVNLKPENLYKKDYLKEGKQKLSFIENKIKEKHLNPNDVYFLINCKHGGFKHAINVIFS